VAKDRQSHRLPHPTRMRQLLRRRWIRRNLIRNGSKQAMIPRRGNPFASPVRQISGEPPALIIRILYNSWREHRECEP
jgi:hypothetical protein